jgi:hypothetical protein
LSFEAVRIELYECVAREPLLVAVAVVAETDSVRVLEAEIDRGDLDSETETETEKGTVAVVLTEPVETERYEAEAVLEAETVAVTLCEAVAVPDADVVTVSEVVNDLLLEYEPVAEREGVTLEVFDFVFEAEVDPL